MLNLKKRNIKKKKNIFLNSILGNFDIFFVDKTIIIKKNIKLDIQKQSNCILFHGLLGNLTLIHINEIQFFKKNKLLFLVINNNLLNNKKSILNLYNRLIKIKLKGVLQFFKLRLVLKGIGFKSNIENNFLILKLGFSHNIFIKIPDDIKIIIQSNNIIFNSIDLIKLTQFVNYIRNLKKPEPYKGKGLLFKDEEIIKKEGKKK